MKVMRCFILCFLVVTIPVVAEDSSRSESQRTSGATDFSILGNAQISGNLSVDGNGGASPSYFNGPLFVGNAWGGTFTAYGDIQAWSLASPHRIGPAILSRKGIIPTRNNIFTSGSSDSRWKDVFSVNGDFSGIVTLQDVRVYGGLSFYNEDGVLFSLGTEYHTTSVPIIQTTKVSSPPWSVNTVGVQSQDEIIALSGTVEFDSYGKATANFPEWFTAIVDTESGQYLVYFTEKADPGDEWLGEIRTINRSSAGFIAENRKGNAGSADYLVLGHKRYARCACDPPVSSQ